MAKHDEKLDRLPYFTEYAKDEGEEAPAEDEGGDIEVVIPEDLSEMSDEELTNVHSSAIDAFNALYGEDGASLSEEGLDALSVLTQGIERVQTEMDARKEAQEGRAEAAAEMAARAGVRAPAEATTLSEDDESESTEELASESDESAPKGDGESETEQNMTASGSKEIRVNLSGMRRKAPTPPPAPAAPERTMADIVKGAQDFKGYAGKGMSWSEVGKGLDRRLASFNRTQYEQANAAGRRLRTQMGMLVIEKPFDEGMVLKSNDPIHIDEVLQRASKENRLPGNSLVAAGGWCAPSETIYDLCELESRDGIFDLPEVGVTRGGIKFTQGPDFAELYANTGFCYTEEEDQAGDYDGTGGGSKPCFTVPCPEFEEARLDYCGLCISAGLLMQRAYPEIIARTTRGALVAHDHKMAANILAQIEAGSTAVTMTPDQVGTTAPVLEAIELQVEHFRTVNRISRSTSLEAVFPYWIRGAIRADLSRRLGVDLLDVSDSRIDGWFRDRGVAPQFVYNWDDLSGTAAEAITWPTEVKFLLYAAGTWVKGGADIITLDTIYDSTLLGTNDFTALFSEEGILVAKMCHDSRVVTVPVCSSGETAGGLDLNCDGTAAAAV